VPAVKRTLLCLSLAALVAAAAASAAQPLVPAAAQDAIAHKAPRLAYVPARGTPPYRYRNWRLAGGRLRIWFANRNEPRKLLVFEARAFHGVCRAGAQQGMQMAGVKVWYGESGGVRQAWRCVHGTKLATWTTLPDRRYSRSGLARITASGHKL
jgi:opacity protein-like surface antigen